MDNTKDFFMFSKKLCPYKLSKNGARLKGQEIS